MVKLTKLQIILIPKEYAPLPIEDINSIISKKFLHLTNPVKSIQSLHEEVSTRYKKLYPKEPELKIMNFQDQNLCDLDDEYTIEDVFENNDIVRVIVDNFFNDNIEFDFHQKRSHEEMQRIEHNVTPTKEQLNRSTSPVSLAPPPSISSNKIPKKKLNETPGAMSRVRITSGMLEKPPNDTDDFNNNGNTNNFENRDDMDLDVVSNDDGSDESDDDNIPISQVVSNSNSQRISKSAILDMYKSRANEIPPAHAHDEVLKNLGIDTIEGNPLLGDNKKRTAGLEAASKISNNNNFKKPNSTPQSKSATTSATSSTKKATPTPKQQKPLAQTQPNVAPAGSKITTTSPPTITKKPPTLTGNESVQALKPKEETIYDEDKTMNLLESIKVSLNHFEDQLLIYKKKDADGYFKLPKYFALSPYHNSKAYTDPIIDCRLNLSDEANYEGPLPYKLKTRSTAHNHKLFTSSIPSLLKDEPINTPPKFQSPPAPQKQQPQKQQPPKQQPPKQQPQKQTPTTTKSTTTTAKSQQQASTPKPKTPAKSNIESSHRPITRSDTNKNTPKPPTLRTSSRPTSRPTQPTRQQPKPKRASPPARQQPKPKRLIDTYSDTEVIEISSSPETDSEEEEEVEIRQPKRRSSGSKAANNKPNGVSSRKNSTTPKNVAAKDNKITTRSQFKITTPKNFTKNNGNSRSPTSPKDSMKSKFQEIAALFIGSQDSSPQGKKNKDYDGDDENENDEPSQQPQQQQTNFASMFSNPKKTTFDVVNSMFGGVDKTNENNENLESPFGTSTDPASLSKNNGSTAAFGVGNSFGKPETTTTTSTTDQNGRSYNSPPPTTISNEVLLESPVPSSGHGSLQLYANKDGEAPLSSSGSSDVESVIEGDDDEDDGQEEDSATNNQKKRLVASIPQKRNSPAPINLQTSNLLPTNSPFANFENSSSLSNNVTTATTIETSASSTAKEKEDQPIVTPLRKPLLPSLLELGSRGVPEVKEIEETTTTTTTTKKGLINQDESLSSEEESSSGSSSSDEDEDDGNKRLFL